MSGGLTGKKGKSITRRVSPKALGDLLSSPPRATLAFVEGTGIEAQSVSFRHNEGRFWFGVKDPPPTGLAPGAPVYLLVDDGKFMTELRGVAVAGRLGERSNDERDQPGIAWFEVMPSRVIAWDYAALRRKRQ